jgi:hypothetical protein
MTNYVFRNPQAPLELEREIIARQLVRGLERVEKFQIEQLSGDSWTHLKIHAPGNLINLFKRIKDKKLKPIIKGNSVIFYIDSSVTPINARMLVGELIANKRTINDTTLDTFRKKIGVYILTIAKNIYPNRKN